ncbi:undecaprenyldiphospho-muramoylpentapeptide beta-N-acetylglucosaminyltransferase [Alcaligenaceae bacterium]|nr:undecaprenyldiphospho-muramoylpentapeptide beta-N-acetylglucosaminyltransferase [Alcaligenaceae bacterium]
MNKHAPTLLVMAGGTGGHIMPGLAVAREMQSRGWNVVWLGDPDRMEGRLVPAQGITLLPLRFSGLRGKGVLALLKLPFTLSSALWQARQVLRSQAPDVILGMGGYVAFPGGVMAKLAGIPLVIHEQNAVAGTANRWLARMAAKVLVGFPGALPGALMVGNPVRQEMLQLAPTAERYEQRDGPLRVLVVGGSLGAAILNRVVPKAMGLLPTEQRPLIRHQAGEQHLADLQTAYAQAGVQAECHAFIDDMAQALAWADVLVCRAGAMTVAEVAAVGVAALFVPLPHAIDDHQTANARYLSDCDGAWLCKQSELTPEWLARWLGELNRSQLAGAASHARQHAALHATQHIADACEQSARRVP